MSSAATTRRGKYQRRLGVRLALGLVLAIPASLGSWAQGQAPRDQPSRPRPAAPAPGTSWFPDPYKLPDPDRVFRLETEEQLAERMRREGRLGLNPLNLKYEAVRPNYPPVPPPETPVRDWGPLAEVVEPPLVCYRRLYFEQINFERYGWDLGLWSPFLSQGKFYWDLATLPYHAGTEICRRYECNAGYCWPGDPVPLLLYPFEWSWTGAAAEAAVIGPLFAIFP